MCLLFPHDNRGIHSHPSPHQSTERDGGRDEGMEGWRGQMGRGMEVEECMTAEEKSDVQRKGGGRERVRECERKD